MSQIYATNTNRYRWYTYLLLFLCYFSRNAAAVDNHDCTGVTGDPVCNALNDERISPETFYTSAPSSIIIGTSGGISAISSLLIMFIIVRSNIRFSTVSHRLVFAMSSADIICSIGMAAGTLAMPKNMVYDFEGKTIGNEFTCSQSSGLSHFLCWLRDNGLQRVPLGLFHVLDYVQNEGYQDTKVCGTLHARGMYLGDTSNCDPVLGPLLVFFRI